MCLTHASGTRVFMLKWRTGESGLSFLHLIAILNTKQTERLFGSYIFHIDVRYLTIVVTSKCDYVNNCDPFDSNAITSENREKNNSREIAHAIWSLDEVMRKSLRGCVIPGYYGRTKDEGPD